MTKVIEKSTTFRDDPRSFDEVVDNLVAAGWQLAMNQADCLIFGHTGMPGHSLIVAKPDGTHA